MYFPLCVLRQNELMTKVMIRLINFTYQIFGAVLEICCSTFLVSYLISPIAKGATDKESTSNRLTSSLLRVININPKCFFSMTCMISLHCSRFRSTRFYLRRTEKEFCQSECKASPVVNARCFIVY